MVDQDLKLKTTVEGADKAAADLKKIDKAQDKISGTTKQAAGPVADLADQQAKLNAAEGDYISVLSQVNPQLGLVADQLLKFAKITNTAGAAQLSLKEITAKATTVLKANAAALKLVAAGGVAALAIWGIVKAYQSLKLEAELATKALAAEADATAKSREEHDKATAAIRAEADQRERLGKLTIAESEQIQAEAARLSRRFGVDQPRAAQFMARFAGAGVPQETLDLLTIAQQRLGGADLAKITPEAGMRPRDIRLRAETAAQQEFVREAAAAQERTANEQARRRRQELQAQITVGRGTLAEEFVAQITTEPEEAKTLLDALARVGGTKGGLEAARRGRAGLGVLIGQQPGFLLEAQGTFDAFGDQRFELTPREFSQLTSAINALNDTMRVRPMAAYQINMGVDAEAMTNRERQPATAGIEREGG